MDGDTEVSQTDDASQNTQGFIPRCPGGGGGKRTKLVKGLCLYTPVPVHAQMKKRHVLPEEQKKKHFMEEERLR